MAQKITTLIKQKPYFQDKDFTLYLADAIALMKSFPADSVDMVFADPPYNLSNGGFTVHAGKRVSVHKGDWDRSKGLDDDLAFHVAWIEAVKRLLKPSGTLWVSGTYHSIYQCGYAIQLLGYKILNDIVWYKPNASPNLSGRYFTASHETLLWARKDAKAKHIYNYQAMKNGEWHLKDQLKNPGKQMRSVWSITTPRPGEKTFGKHPTQKPIALLERVILSSTHENDIILDPFVGSATTGLVAAQYGRQFIGIDNEPDYLELSKKRYQQLVKS